MASSARQICTQCGVAYDSATHHQCKCADEDDGHLMLLLQLHALAGVLRPYEGSASAENADSFTAIEISMCGFEYLEDPSECDEEELVAGCEDSWDSEVSDAAELENELDEHQHDDSSDPFERFDDAG